MTKEFEQAIKELVVSVDNVLANLKDSDGGVDADGETYEDIQELEDDLAHVKTYIAREL